jgi:hypothetical protein
MTLLQSLEATALATWVRESGSAWAYPFVLTLHTVGLAMLVGGSTVIGLRILGVNPDLPLPALARLFRLIWVGLAINVGSGALLFMGDAQAKGTQAVFWVKLACIACGLWAVWQVQVRVFGRAETLAHAEASAPARRLATIALAAWVGAITAGRLMAYL